MTRSQCKVKGWLRKKKLEPVRKYFQQSRVVEAEVAPHCTIVPCYPQAVVVEGLVAANKKKHRRLPLVSYHIHSSCSSLDHIDTAVRNIDSTGCNRNHRTTGHWRHPHTRSTLVLLSATRHRQT